MNPPTQSAGKAGRLDVRPLLTHMSLEALRKPPCVKIFIQMTHFSDTENSHLKIETGVPVVAQGLTNPTRNQEVAGSIPGLAQWVRDPAWP